MLAVRAWPRLLPLMLRSNVTHSDPDDTALGGAAKFFPWGHGRIFYKELGTGNPRGCQLFLFMALALVSSSFMWRKNFDPLAQYFRVYAFDLLGFGFSDKPAAAPYSADLYVELISDFIREVAGGPANVVASSLGAAYAVRVADEHPELVNAMILNAPAGYDTLNTRTRNGGRCVLRVASVSRAWELRSTT